MGLAAAHRSWCSRRKIDHFPPLLDIDMSSIEYAYRGDRLPCSMVRGVHFVGSAPVHVLNLVPSLVPGRERWYCGVVVVPEVPAAMGNSIMLVVDSIIPLVIRVVLAG